MRPVAASILALTIVGTSGEARGDDGAQHSSIFFLPSRMEAGRHLGTRKAGLLCLPAGTLAWRDADPGVAALTGAAEKGWGVTAGPDEFTRLADVAYKISGRLVDARIDACVATRGILRSVGGRKVTQVHGSITVQWRIFDVGRKQVVSDQQSIQAVDLADKDLSIAAAITTAVEASAADLAARFVRR